MPFWCSLAQLKSWVGGRRERGTKTAIKSHCGDGLNLDTLALCSGPDSLRTCLPGRASCGRLAAACQWTAYGPEKSLCLSLDYGLHNIFLHNERNSSVLKTSLEVG